MMSIQLDAFFCRRREENTDSGLFAREGDSTIITTARNTTTNLLLPPPQFDDEEAISKASNVTARSPSLLVQDESGQGWFYIQYDQLVYFEDLVSGMDTHKTIWEAIIARVGELLRQYVVENLMIAACIPRDRSIKIGYAGFNRRRYEVHFVMPVDFNLFKSKVVLSPTSTSD